MTGWSDLFSLLWPELLLISAACALFILGTITRTAARKAAPVIALLALLGAVAICYFSGTEHGAAADAVQNGSIHLSEFTAYIKLISAGTGMLFVLLAWPSNREGTANSSIHFGQDIGEFFALLLLSICGIFLVASANDFILFFLGIELASIPTYIMVSTSRPLPAAQEAGVKYFFLGAMSAALMLFGLSYLYGSTGSISLVDLSSHFAHTAASISSNTVLTRWELLGVVMLMAGLCFKIAAFPMHFYAGDVYEGAASPVTALISFVPKASGFVALIKLFGAVGAGRWAAPQELVNLVWWLAVLTMTAGNILGLMQNNIKRVLAYSSIAHTGYMLVALALALGEHSGEAIQGILFYLAAYGLMNVGALGVLMQLPSRTPKPATSAETCDDIAGAGRAHSGLGLALAVACFSLTGLPLTVGFFGKIYLIRPALHAGAAASNYWLIGIMMANAAISAGYYLRIVGTMFFSPTSYQGSITLPDVLPLRVPAGRAVALAVWIASLATLGFGVVFPLTDMLHSATVEASRFDQAPQVPTASLTP